VHIDQDDAACPRPDGKIRLAVAGVDEAVLKHPAKQLGLDWAFQIPLGIRGEHVIDERKTRRQPGGEHGVGGVAASPGDVVVADDDGVIVIPAAEAAASLLGGRAVETDEAQRRAAILAGGAS